MDRGIWRICPAKRVCVVFLYGFILSVLSLYLTDDEYLKGPPMEELPHASQNDFAPVYVSWKNVGCEIAPHQSVLRAQTG
jgi:hypothetical protein